MTALRRLPPFAIDLLIALVTFAAIVGAGMLAFPDSGRLVFNLIFAAAFVLAGVVARQIGRRLARPRP